MDTLPSNIADHAYPLLFGRIFSETSLPHDPAALALLLAGGAAAKDPMRLGAVLLTSFSALLLGDTIMFLLGRRTGWWLLGVLCKISLNPESCIFRSAESFRRRGRMML